VRWVVLDAPLDSSGRGRGEERAPAALRDAGLLRALDADDGGSADARIDDPVRDPVTGLIGAAQVRRATASIAARLTGLLGAGRRPLVRGDCTILPGILLALPPGIRLWFVDGHPDFLDGRDVLDPVDLPAVTYPEPDGLRWADLEALVAPLARSDRLLGVSVANLNADEDPDGRHARRVVEVLAAALVS
jgi:arginase family enzyme